MTDKISKIMASNSAQCGGKDNILAMYQNRNIEAWSISVGRQFLFTGIGKDELSEMLDMMEEGSNSCYTLKIYKGVSDRDDITEKSAANGSFNFYIKERTERREPGTNNFGAARGIGAIQRRIEERIADKIDDMLDNDEAPKKDKPKTIGEIVSDPDEIKEWLGVIGMVKSLLSGQPMNLASIANVSRAGQKEEATVNTEYSEQDQQRLITAINTLHKNDPKILEHLEKLAAISETKKDFFNTLLTMLNGI